MSAIRRETIYESLSGMRVERLFDEERSYIYKPVVSQSVVEREKWVSERIAPLMPDVIIPRIVAASHGKDDGSWLLYEDLGELQHGRTTPDIIEACGWIPRWHRLPAALITEPSAGHSPLYSHVWQTVCEQADGLAARLADVDAGSVQAWAEQLDSYKRAIDEHLLVVSHGDFHPLNAAFNDHQRIVLDWEYIHLNHPYWDLYSIMDITSYRYDKVPLTNAERELALERYWQHSKAADRAASFSTFVSGYYVYASVYSAWIAGLIASDLEQGRASRGALLKQKRETSAVFADCLSGLGLLKKESSS